MIQGIVRTPQRALLRATGLTDDDLQRPLIGIVNTCEVMAEPRQSIKYENVFPNEDGWD